MSSPAVHQGPQQASTDRTAVHLLAASQPDIVRSVQKDELYQQQAVEGLYELIRNTCGAFTALQYAKEIKLVALVLYHGLTTGTGLPTLGEEYCNMMQVAGDGRCPQLGRRAALIALSSLAPYITDLLIARLERQQQRLEELGQDAFSWSAAVAHHTTYTVQAHDAHHSVSHQGSSSVTQPEQMPQAVRSARRAWHCLAAWPRECAMRVEAAMAPVWPHLRHVLSYQARLHLALFYIYGIYYSWAHRLAGIRYASVARPLQGRPSYRILGLLLVAQLGVAAALQARQLVCAMLARRRAAVPHSPGASQQPRSHAQLTPHHAVMLDDSRLSSDDSEEAVEAGEASDDNGLLQGWTHVDTSMQSSPSPAPSSDVSAQPTGATPVKASGMDQPTQGNVTQCVGQPLVVLSGRPCPLCISPRKYPTSTPCGHVFCWECVARWCLEKPECPLCRSHVLLTQLVPLYHCAHF